MAHAHGVGEPPQPAGDFAGDEDDRDVAAASAKGRDQLASVHVGHMVVDHQAGGLRQVFMSEELAAARLQLLPASRSPYFFCPFT